MSVATSTPRSTSATDVLVVIPTYNERENLPGLGSAVLALGPTYRIVVVDDNSPDGTGQLADDLARAHPGRVAVLHQPAKTGLGLAYVAGFGHALNDGAGLIVSMDADYSHAPADLLRLVAAAADHDLVIGSRYVPGGRTIGWPMRRRLLSRLGGLYARAVLGVRIADLTSGFKVYRRATLAAIDLAGVHAGGYGFNIEVTYRALRNGARVIEMPISFAERAAGLSKISWPIILEAAVVVWRLRLGRTGRGRRG